MEHAWVNIVGLALDLVGPTTVVPYATDNGAQITAGHVDGLSIVERLNGSEQIQVLLKNIGELQQHTAPVVGGDLPPWTIKGLASSSHGKIDILLVTLVDLCDDLLSGGVDNVELLLVDRLDPLAVNVAVGRGLLGF